MRTVRNITVAVDPGHQYSQPLPEKNKNSRCKPVPASKLHPLSYLQPINRRPYRISISVSTFLNPSFKKSYFHFMQNAFKPLYACKTRGWR
jgi:hypothetical protein